MLLRVRRYETHLTAQVSGARMQVGLANLSRSEQVSDGMRNSIQLLAEQHENALVPWQAGQQAQANHMLTVEWYHAFAPDLLAARQAELQRERSRG